MVRDLLKPKVFISHASEDVWVARQIAANIQQRGAETFLDNADIRKGDDFEEAILAAAETCTELLVLFTPWSLGRRYVWMEIGVFFGRRQRIVGALHGVSAGDIAGDRDVPVAIKRLDLLSINDIDRYFRELGDRVSVWEQRQ